MISVESPTLKVFVLVALKATISETELVNSANQIMLDLLMPDVDDGTGRIKFVSNVLVVFTLILIEFV